MSATPIIRKHFSMGFGLIGLMLTFPALLIILVIIAFAYCEAHKSYWDGKVTEMCKKDGGVRVNERVVATSQYVDKDGNIRIPPKANRENPFEWEAKPSDLFFYEMIVNDIKTGSLTIKRFHFKVIRSVDQKVLGESIAYGRAGGDFPTFAHSSSYICPENVERDLFSAVFEKLN